MFRNLNKCSLNMFRLFAAPAFASTTYKRCFIKERSDKIENEQTVDIDSLYTKIPVFNSEPVNIENTEHFVNIIIKFRNPKDLPYNNLKILSRDNPALKAA